jgi:hypothetical protein
MTPFSLTLFKQRRIALHEIVGEQRTGACG